MNLTGTLKRVRFGATSDLNFFEAKNWATWRQWVNTKEWLSSIDSGPRANFNMPVSFHKHISSEKSTLMIGLGLYKFGCQNVPVSSRLLYKSFSKPSACLSGSGNLICSRARGASGAAHNCTSTVDRIGNDGTPRRPHAPEKLIVADAHFTSTKTKR